MERTAFTPEPFIPHPLLRNSHAQTLAGAFYRSEQGVDFRRLRIDTPDGDFVDLDFAEITGFTWQQLGDHAPILYFLHGLEGNARKGYAVDLYKLAAQAGYRCVGLNHRSCGGEMNRTARFYHMGATDDVGFALEWLEKEYPSAPIVMVGISLGGNMLLKFLGEQGAALQGRIQAGVAISPPIVATGKQAINYGMGRFYGYYLLRKLQRKVRQKASLLANTSADIAGALRAGTLREFDEAITAPLHGFRDAEDYYDRSNSVRFLETIRIPALIIRAKDDPFFNQDIPFDLIANNPALYGAFPEYGGHVGFIEGITPLRYDNWAQRQALRFFQQIKQLS
jgi:hypothetical protein